METDTDLKRFEKRAYLSFFRDGLWDICLGLFFIGWGAGLLWDAAAYGSIWFLVLYFLVFGIKRRWIVPRTGYVRMDRQMRRVLVGFVLLLGLTALLGVFAVVVFSGNTRPAWLDDYFPLLFSAVIALPVSFVGVWFAVRRYYGYALLVLVGGALNVWLDLPWAYGFFGAGGIVAAAGIALLVTFLRTCPRPETEGPYAGE
jgi:hypothetical protein